MYLLSVLSATALSFGTVIRPLTTDAEYDLDNVATLTLPKKVMTQRQLKDLYGLEIKDYSRAHDMCAPAEEKNRCWRLKYADEVNFHLDTLPSVPEDAARIAALLAAGVPRDLAERAIAITDRRHPLYDQKTLSLLSSNPRGFARWFEQQARPIAVSRIRQLVESRAYATVDDVPPYEWKTPLSGRYPVAEAPPRRDVRGHTGSCADLHDHHEPGGPGIPRRG